MQQAKIRSLEASAAEVDKNGLRDFYWPLSWEEQRKFRDAFVGGYAALARSLQERGDEDGDLLAILAMEFVQEAMRGWFVATIMTRYHRRGENISAPWLGGGTTEQATFWQPQRDRIAFLRTRFPSSSWRALFRPLYGMMQKDGTSWLWPQFADFRHQIIATNSCPLTQRHIEECGQRPVLVSMRYWFGDASDNIPADTSALALRDATSAAVLNLFADAALQSGDAMPAALLSHLNGWIKEASAVCRWYLHALLKRPRALPAQLWTGSGGYIFRRILHVAVRKAGGHVTSHDHGSGLGLFDLIDTNLTEFVTPDTFMTFSQQQVLGYRTQQRDAFRMRVQWPTIAAVQPRKERSVPTVAAFERDKPKSILFVANQYRGEKITMTPIEFDLVAVDWQARLFAHLMSLGYDVRMRPHPDSVTAPPEGLRTMGVSFAGGTFAEALASADIVILDYLHTSVLRDVLCSGKPVMTFEFGHCPPNAVAYGPLARRMRFVPGTYDETNRAQTDWTALPGAIADAIDMHKDTAFLPLFEN